ncbi:MAG: hypothetical protein IJ148_10635 [Bacteroidaceae bacterium]|nr:hypothetical protein [Bacteroidaceae bacterium]
MIAFQKDIWSPTIEGTKETVVKAESSNRTKALTQKFREDNLDQHKRNLPAVCYMATFEESENDKGIKGCWRKQETAHLNGLVVSDFDHLVENPGTLFSLWQTMLDLKQEGILKVFVTPSGQGIKVVSKWRKEWGNLAENQLQIARMLDMERYLDASGKDASRTAFVPMRSDVLYEDEEVYTYFDPECDETWGEAYRSPSPTLPKGESLNDAGTPQSSGEGASFTEREQAIINALNAFYGKELGEGKKHPTFCQQTSQWLCWLLENNPERAIAVAYELDYVKNWKPQPGEVEDLINSAAKKKLLKSTPPALKEILEKAGIDKEETQETDGEEGLPFEEWAKQIRGLFDVYPCVREICEPHPQRLWPFLLFASAALLGTDMTLCWYYFYDQPEKPRRLNYNVLGIGDPASGKGALVRIAGLLTEPLEQSDQLANDAINAWKEDQRSKGANKDKPAKPKAVVRLHGPRTSNNVFINDMMNAWTEVDGERIQMHMLTIDTEALNSIKMQKGGSWIDRQVMEIKSWSNEKDSQQYANLDSVTGFFNVYWNLVRTCTPMALKSLANERNFGSGWPTRVSAIPIPGTGFKMIELRRYNQKAIDADETLKQWAYRMDRRQGELPIWPLVEHAWHWTSDHMEIAAFNGDKADELLLKRIAPNTLAIAAPFVDMRHWEEREQKGTYEVDEQDKALLDLLLDIQYRTTTYWFGALARNYFEEQTKDATQYRRRTTRFEYCYMRLPEVFTTQQFSQVFGYANSNSASKTLDRLMKDKTIERTKRGEYRKRVQSLS